MKCAKLSVSRWKFGGITICQGCRNESVKSNKKHQITWMKPGEIEYRTSSKTTHSRWYVFLTEAIKVWHTPLKMCFFFRLATRQQKSFSFKGSIFNDLSWLIQNHHLFFQLHKCCLTIYVWGNPLAPLGVSRWRFWSSLAMLAMFSTRPGLEWPSDWSHGFSSEGASDDGSMVLLHGKGGVANLDNQPTWMHQQRA